MEKNEFKAYIVDEEDNKYIGKITKRNIKDLPKGDLLIKVYYSSLNYKDALSATGNRGVTKNYPHTPGIDAVGIVVKSEDNLFCTDEKILLMLQGKLKGRTIINMYK